MTRLNWNRPKVYEQETGVGSTGIRRGRTARRCARCDRPLHGGPDGNIKWLRLNGKWKPGPLCKRCSEPLTPP